MSELEELTTRAKQLAEALIAEHKQLIAEYEQMRARIQELSVKPLYPEAAVRAVWNHGCDVGRTWRHHSMQYADHAEEVTRVFVEALRDA